jgi:hypothetical protein
MKNETVLITGGAGFIERARERLEITQDRRLIFFQEISKS